MRKKKILMVAITVLALMGTVFFIAQQDLFKADTANPTVINKAVVTDSGGQIISSSDATIQITP